MPPLNRSRKSALGFYTTAAKVVPSSGEIFVHGTHHRCHLCQQLAHINSWVSPDDYHVVQSPSLEIFVHGTKHRSHLSQKLAHNYLSLARAVTSIFFCRDKRFVVTNTCLWPQIYVCNVKNTSFVATKVCLSRDKTIKLCRNKRCDLSRLKFCLDKHTFVATKDEFCRDKKDTCGSSRQWYISLSGFFMILFCFGTSVALRPWCFHFFLSLLSFFVVFSPFFLLPAWYILVCIDETVCFRHKICFWQ